MKRLWLLLMAAVLAFSLSALAACDEKTPNNQPEATVNSGSYLTVEDNNLKLTTGETFSLSIKKTDSNGKEETITKIECVSDAPLIAAYEDGAIVAKKAGKTYLHFTVDGIKTAVFVEVNDVLESSSFSVRCATEPIYKGIPVKTRVFFTENGSKSVEIENVSWSVPVDKASIDESGVFTALTFGEIKVTANFTYNGTAQKVERTIVVYEPVTYAFADQEIRLATTKTLSGVKNDKYVCYTPALIATDMLTGEQSPVKVSEYTLSTTDESLAEIKDGAICSNETAGITHVVATITASGRQEMATVKIVTAISSIADMDVLSLACYNQPDLLKGDYALTNDIDYNGDVIMPIAPFNDGDMKTRNSGIQWKYRLEKDGDKYKYVEREKYGESGRGLSDEEFIALADAYGINGLNKYSFSGSFDGNGYSIKNAALFYGIHTRKYDDYSDGTFATYSHVFGYVKGVIENLAFDNLSLQDPTKSPVSLDVVYDGDGKFVSGVIQKVKTKVDSNSYKLENFEHNYFDVDSYYINGVSVIGRGVGCTVNNVYVDVTINLPSRLSAAGMLISWGSDNVSAENCAVALHTNDDVCLRVRALSGAVAYNAGTFKNNIAVGEKWKMQEDIDTKNFGENGNWWTATDDWSDLFSKTAGANAKNVSPLDEVIATFDTRVWDLSALQTNVAPKLKNGCSLAN